MPRTIGPKRRIKKPPSSRISRRNRFFYINGDKERAILIMDKKEYDEGLMGKLNIENFHELRIDLLPELILLTLLDTHPSKDQLPA